jgi:hypothetical protein
VYFSGFAGCLWRTTGDGGERVESANISISERQLNP